MFSRYIWIKSAWDSPLVNLINSNDSAIPGNFLVDIHTHIRRKHKYRVTKRVICIRKMHQKVTNMQTTRKPAPFRHVAQRCTFSQFMMSLPKLTLAQMSNVRSSIISGEENSLKRSCKPLTKSAWDGRDPHDLLAGARYRESRATATATTASSSLNFSGARFQSKDEQSSWNVRVQCLHFTRDQPRDIYRAYDFSDGCLRFNLRN